MKYSCPHPMPGDSRGGSAVVRSCFYKAQFTPSFFELTLDSAIQSPGDPERVDPITVPRSIHKTSEPKSATPGDIQMRNPESPHPDPPRGRSASSAPPWRCRPRRQAADTAAAGGSRQPAGDETLPAGRPASNTLSTVVVTGSRINRSVASRSPRQPRALTAVDLQKAAQPNLFNTLIELPALQGSTGRTTSPPSAPAAACRASAH